MVEKINTGSKWSWLRSPTGVKKAERRRSDNGQRDSRPHSEDRYSGEEREESQNRPTPGGTAGATEQWTAGAAPARDRAPQRGARIDIHA